LVAGIVLALAAPQIASATTTTVGNDNFTRSNTSSGWGTSPRGGAWAFAKTGSAKFSIAHSRGQVSGLAPGTSSTAALHGATARDVDLVARIGLPSGAARTYNALEVRRQSDGTRYRGRLNVNDKGQASLAFSRVSLTNEVNLGTYNLPFTAQPGSVVRLEFQVTGTSTVSFSGRAFLNGQSVPAWQLKGQDSSAKRIQKTGNVAWWAYASSGNAKPITMTLDDFTAYANPGAPTTPVQPPAAPAPAPTPKPTPTPAPAPSQTPAPAPTAPVPPVTSTPEPSRGSAAVGDAAYPVPAGAIIVATTGNDAAAGSLSAPLRTVAEAVRRATSGSTIVIRGGSYNESVFLSASKSITIQSYPHEAVWFEGSKIVTDWTKTGSTWTTPWDFFPSNVILGKADNPDFVDPKAPLAARFDQVFFNGQLLTQVASAADVRPGTFSVDSNAKTVTVGNEPSTGQIRISNLSQAIGSTAPDVTLRGFGVRRYASQASSVGAVRLGAVDNSASNLVIEDSAWIGLNNSQPGGKLDHLTVVRSGLMGVGVNAGYGFSMTNSVLENNNNSHFRAAPVAGGFKITRARGVVVSNNLVKDNYASGMWFDESCYDIVATHNTITNNSEAGIEVELSQKAVIADNVITGGKEPVYILNSGDVQVVNNSIASGSPFGVRVAQDYRRATDPSVPGHDPKRPNPDPTVPWLTKDVSVVNNAFGSSSGFQIYALDAKSKGLTVQGNLFNRRVNGSSVLVAWGYAPDSSFTAYNTPEDLARAVGPSWKNAQTASPSTLSDISGEVKKNVAIAQPLPAEIASLIGVPAGTQWIGAID
jgi:hypothetical protein